MTRRRPAGGPVLAGLGVALLAGCGSPGAASTGATSPAPATTGAATSSRPAAPSRVEATHRARNPFAAAPKASSASSSFPSSSFPSSSSASSSSGSSSSASSSAPVPLSRVGIVQSDVLAGSTVSLVPQGTSLRKPTLDLCDYGFTSERLRVARRQVTVRHGTAATGVSNEVVAYRDAASAALAVEQWRAAAASCRPGSTYRFPGGGTYRLDSVKHGPQPRLPAQDNDVLNGQITMGGRTVYVVTIVQRRDRYLTGIWGTFGFAPTRPVLKVVGALGITAGRRLVSVVPEG